MLSFLPWLGFDLALIKSVKLLYISYSEPEAAFGGSHVRELTWGTIQNQSSPNASSGNTKPNINIQLAIQYPWKDLGAACLTA